MIMVVGASPIPTYAKVYIPCRYSTVSSYVCQPSLNFVSPILLDPPISKGAADVPPQDNTPDSGAHQATASRATASGAAPVVASSLPPEVPAAAAPPQVAPLGICGLF
jgi:hypothetical protein